MGKEDGDGGCGDGGHKDIGMGDRDMVMGDTGMQDVVLGDMKTWGCRDTGLGDLVTGMW